MQTQEKPPFSQIDLLPPETGQRRRTRLVTAGVIVAGAFILSIIGAIYAIQSVRLSDIEDKTATQQATNQRLQGEIDELQSVEQLQTQLEETRALVASLVGDRVHWSGVLRDVSLVIPAEAWLTGFSATLDASTTALPPTGTTTAPTTTTAPPTGTTTAPATGVQGLIGQITFTGYAMSHRDVALWLSRLEDVGGFANPWLSSSQKTKIGEETVVQFQSSVDLTEEAQANYQKGGQA